MILVTGASGFIGSYLVPELSQKHNVRCIVRKESLRKIRGTPSIEIIEGDIGSLHTVRSALKNVKTVIHLAASLRKRSEEEIQRTNVEATRLIVEEAKRQSVQHFVFISTENVLREDLNDPYPRTKREAEHIVQTMRSFLILRPCFVYGPGDNHGLGRIVEMIRKRKIIPIFGGLKTQIQPIFVRDFVKLIIRALSEHVEGTFTVSGPENLSMNDWIRRCIEISGHKRILVKAPYLVFWTLALLADRFAPGSGWGTSQLRNIYGSRIYKMDDKMSRLIPQMTPIDHGLRSWIK